MNRATKLLLMLSGLILIGVTSLTRTAHQRTASTTAATLTPTVARRFGPAQTLCVNGDLNMKTMKQDHICGTVRVGMTKDEVTRELGSNHATHVLTIAGATIEDWQYHDWPVFEYRPMLEFDNGIVTAISDGR